MSRGDQHAKADAEVRKHSHTVRVDNDNGKRVDKSIQAKGEAITKRADLKEAAKQAKGK